MTTSLLLFFYRRNDMENDENWNIEYEELREREEAREEYEAWLKTMNNEVSPKG